LIVRARLSLTLDGHQRLMDKLDFLSFLESTGREHRAVRQIRVGAGVGEIASRRTHEAHCLRRIEEQ
jgi:hypothetical protein